MQIRNNLSRHIVAQFIIILFILAAAKTVPAFQFGVNADNWKGQISHPEYLAALESMKVEFIVWHIAPEEVMDTQRLLSIIEFCRKNNFGYLFNTEIVNYVPGVPYFQHSDGTYRWDIDKKILESLKEDPLFLGVVYDEPMLMQSMNGTQVNGNTVKPYFAETSEMPVPEAYETVVKKISELSAFYNRYNKRLVFEMVFPDYAHAAARGGAIPAAKLLKENYNDLMYYVYSGAARQYNQPELWACVDLWFLDRFPDKGNYKAGFHSPDDLFEALKFTNQKGYDYVYIEHVKGLIDGSFKLSEYGRKVVEFQKTKSSLEQSNWKRIKPKYVIRRFPDGYWGQDYSFFVHDHPYGSHVDHPELKKESLKWLKLLNTMSNDAIPAEANTWNSQKHPYFSKNPYRANAGLPPFSLYDQNASKIPRSRDSKFMDLTK